MIDNGYNLTRYTKDKLRNNYGHRRIELCKNLKILIVNGRLGKDKYIGKFTCKNASFVDYIIVSLLLYTNVVFFNVANYCEFYSDVHCVVEC